MELPRSQFHNLEATPFEVAYAEIHDGDETPPSAYNATPFAWFATRGVTVVRVLSDNGSADFLRAWSAAYHPSPG